MSARLGAKVSKHPHMTKPATFSSLQSNPRAEWVVWTEPLRLINIMHQ